MPPQYDSKQESSPEVQRLQSGSESEPDLSDSGEAIDIKKRLRTKEESQRPKKRKLLFPTLQMPKGTHWKSLNSRAPMLEHIRVHHPRMDVSRMTEAWWQEGITGKISTLLATCNVCQYESRPTISNIQQGRGFGCFCNGGVPCTTREYYDYMMEKVLVGPKHNRMDFSTMTRAWWQKEIKNAVSKLLGTCTVCDHESRPSLNDIQQGQGFGCECTGGLTEKFVYKVLRDSSSLHIDCHGQDKRLRIPGEKPCKRMVDFWAAGPTHIHVYAAVELDGGQHFGPCRIFDHEESWRGDREKQARLVKLGGRLCRVEQEWVYDNMNEPWMPFVLRRLSAIVASTAPGTLVTLDVHAARYAVLHAPHWEECGGSVSAPVSLADLKKEFAASRGLIENRD